MELGVSEYDQEMRNLGELPDTLYHVTTDTSAVQATGLKTREELSQGKGVGLGGGTSNTISFTTDEALAKDILTVMRERHEVLNDPATHLPRLVEEAKQGIGADRPWWGEPGQSSTMAVKWEGDSADVLSGGGIERLIEGKHLYRSSLGAKTVDDLIEQWEGSWAESTYVVDPDKIKLVSKGGLGVASVFEVEYTEAGHATAVGDFLDEYVLYRDYAGGPSDPLFISNDDLAFKNLDPDDFSIIKATPKEGTRGYKVSGMSEWRTWTGEVVDEYEVIK